MRGHLGSHQDDIDVIAEACSIILHDAKQKPVRQAEGGARLHAGQHPRIKACLLISQTCFWTKKYGWMKAPSQGLQQLHESKGS